MQAKYLILPYKLMGLMMSMKKMGAIPRAMENLQKNPGQKKVAPEEGFEPPT